MRGAKYCINFLQHGTFVERRRIPYHGIYTLVYRRGVWLGPGPPKPMFRTAPPYARPAAPGPASGPGCGKSDGGAGGALSVVEVVAKSAFGVFVAQLGASSNERELPAAVAKKHEHLELARLLELAHETGQRLWEPSPDPDVLPSSSAWNESRALQSACEMRVAYGGGVIVIPQGATYYVDGFGRTLVGWHGTYDPPEGMC